MSRKHYKAFAELLTKLRKDEGIYANGLQQGTFTYIPATLVARAIADVCQADNPRFDRLRFLKAAGEVTP